MCYVFPLRRKNDKTTFTALKGFFQQHMLMMDDYHALKENLSAPELSKKYHGLKRNYDSMTRICKEKCLRNNTLEGELTKLSEIKEKYDKLQVTNEENAQEKKALRQENEVLNRSVLSTVYIQSKLYITNWQMNIERNYRKH